MTSEPGRLPYRWTMLVLLWLSYIAFGAVARAISPLVTPIQRDLGLSYSQMGFVLGSWQLTYILVAVTAGTILDRWGVRKSIFAGVVIMGLSVTLRYFAYSFPVLLATVALFGAGGPMISIGGPKAISEWFFGRSRGTAVGIYTTGPWIGGLLALSLTNSLLMPLVNHDWRVVFVCYGMAAFSIALLWWLRAREPETSMEMESVPMNAVFRSLLNVRTVRILLIMALFSFTIGHGFNNWLPKILESKGISASTAGLMASIPLIAGIPTVLLVPRWVPPRLRGRTIALCSLVTIVNLMVVVTARGPILYTGLATMGVFNSPFMPLMLLILIDSPEVETRHMGSAGGMFFCIAEIGGFAGPLVMGVLVDITSTFLAGAVFLACLCVAICLMTLLLKDATPSPDKSLDPHGPFG